MELMQTIWTHLSMPNEGLMAIIFNSWGIPFIFIEITLHVLLFTTILNIPATKKQKIIAVVVLSFISCISNTITQKPYSAYINMILYPIFITLIFKINFFKSIIAEFIPITISSILEICLCKLYVFLFNGTYDDIYSIPIVRLPIAILIYLSMYLIYRLIKYFKINIVLFDNMNKKSKIILLINFIFAIIAIGIQFYIIGYYLNTLPLFICLMSAISLIAYFSISIFSLIKTNKLEATNQSLEEAQMYNKTLELLHENLRIFKHDFANIMQSIDGYIVNDDMKGLKKYYKNIKLECDNSNNLAALNPSLVNDPALYSLIASKYYKAEKAGISFNIRILVNFNEIPTAPYILTRLLGILLDNAIEAAEKCDDKEIAFEVYGHSNNSNVKKYVISIKNTYINKDVDIDKIREKGYTSKTNEEGSHGLGLWEVNKILKKSKNMNLHTTKNDKYFTQNLEIYDIA